MCTVLYWNYNSSEPNCVVGEQVICVSLWEEEGAQLSYLWWPILNILHLTFEQLFNFSNALLSENCCKSRRKFVETFRGSFTMLSLPTRLYFRFHQSVLAVLNMIFFNNPWSHSSQSLSKVFQNQQLQHPLVSLKHLYILWAGYQWLKLSYSIITLQSDALDTTTLWRIHVWMGDGCRPDSNSKPLYKNISASPYLWTKSQNN